MLPDKQGNSNSVEGSVLQHNQQHNLIGCDAPGVQPVQGKPDNQSLQKNNSTSSEDLLREKIDSLNEEIKSVKRENRIFNVAAGSLAVGGIIGANWSTIAPVLETVAQAIVVASPIGGIVIGSIAALGIALFCAYKMFEHRAEIKEFAEKAFGKAKGGLEYVAEKTVKGAKYTGKKIANGAVYSKDKVKKGYEYSAGSLKEGAHFIKEKTKEGGSSILNATAETLYRLAGETNYLNEIKKFTPDELKKTDEVRKDIEAIFADKKGNSQLVKNILSEIKSKIIPQIDSKIAESRDTLKSMDKIVPTDPMVAEEGIQKWSKNIDKLEGQKKFTNGLNAENLNTLITQRSLGKGSYYLDSIFSEYYGEIKRIVREEKFHASLRRKYTAEEKAKRSSSTSSLPNGGSLNSLNSVSTDGSTVQLLNPTKHKEVEPTTSWIERAKGKISTLFRAAEETSSTECKDFSEQSPPVKFATVRRSNSNLSQARAPILVPTPTVPKDGAAKPDRDRSHSVGSGVSNASSSSSGTESANSFSFAPASQPLPSDGQIPVVRSSSPVSTDSGVSSTDSSPRHSGTHPGLKIQGSEDEINKVRNGLKRRNSLQDGEFIKPATQITVHAEVHQHDTTTKPNYSV